MGCSQVAIFCLVLTINIEKLQKKSKLSTNNSADLTVAVSLAKQCQSGFISEAKVSRVSTLRLVGGASLTRNSLHLTSFPFSRSE